MAYKKITDVIASEITEARNSVGKTSNITIAGKQDVSIGDFVLLKLKIGAEYRYFSMQVVNVDFSGGNTSLELENPIQQLFNCILPNIDTLSGPANTIIKTLLDTAVTNNFINLYVDTKNIDAVSKSYSDINVKNRYIGDIIQDICLDTGYSIWVGYDEINDEPLAFFFKKDTDIKSLNIAFKEGANIISENLKKSSLNDIINYVFLYYYPDKYPADESWTEEVRAKRITRAIDTFHLGDAGIVDDIYDHTYGGDFHLGDVVIWCEAIAHLTQDAHVEDTRIYVDSTTDFANSGTLLINGATFDYTSKGSNYFDLASSLTIDILKDYSIIYQYVPASYDDENNHPAITKAELFGLETYLYKGKITRIILPSFGGSAGTELYISFKKQSQLSILNQVVINISDTDVDVDWEIPENGLYTILVSAKNVGKTYNFYPAMGECMSLSKQSGDSEIAYWWHIGSPMKKGYGLGDFVIAQSYPIIDHTTPDKMPAISIYQLIDEVGTDLWSGGAYSYNRYYKLETQQIETMAQEGADCLRLEFAGTYELTGLSVNLAIYSKIFLRFWGKLTTIKLMEDDTKYWYSTLDENVYWQDKTFNVSSMTKVGTPTAINKIQIISMGRAFIDSLYFLGNTEGTLLIIKDDASISKYGQKPYPFYAKGITESSLAISLGNSIIQAKKEPSWQGEILVEDNTNLNIFSKVKVIIPSKSIDAYFNIKEITHFSDGTAKIILGEPELDLSKTLRNLQKDVEELKLTLGDNTPAEGDTLPYRNHAVKHELGGSDEISVAGLPGVLSEPQNTEWSRIEDKPVSTVSDIDDAVTKKHTHANKALLDTYDQSNTNIADAVSKKHEHTNKTYLDAIPKSKYDATTAPSTSNDNTQGYSIGSRWFDITNKDEYVCLDATTGNAVWKKTN
ncbi:MAG: hypothetical protein GYA14_11500 [Ignavibacteria bacterium]|nr:hypothetical protein [Ignavibacteria bacterium]